MFIYDLWFKYNIKYLYRNIVKFCRPSKEMSLVLLFRKEGRTDNISASFPIRVELHSRVISFKYNYTNIQNHEIKFLL